MLDTQRIGVLERLDRQVGAAGRQRADRVHAVGLRPRTERAGHRLVVHEVAARARIRARGEQQVACMRRQGSETVPTPIPPALREALRPYGAP